MVDVRVCVSRGSKDFFVIVMDRLMFVKGPGKHWCKYPTNVVGVVVIIIVAAAVVVVVMVIIVMMMMMMMMTMMMISTTMMVPTGFSCP